MKNISTKWLKFKQKAKIKIEKIFILDGQKRFEMKNNNISIW